MSMKSKKKKQEYPQEIGELLKIYGNITDNYHLILNLITQLSILMDSYYEGKYDDEATVDCIGYTINHLYDMAMQEEVLINQSTEMHCKIFVQNR